MSLHLCFVFYLFVFSWKKTPADGDVVPLVCPHPCCVTVCLRRGPCASLCWIVGHVRALSRPLPYLFCSREEASPFTVYGMVGTARRGEARLRTTSTVRLLEYSNLCPARPYCSSRRDSSGLGILQLQPRFQPRLQPTQPAQPGPH